MEFRKRATKNQDDEQDPPGPPSYHEALGDTPAPAYDNANTTSLAAGDGVYPDEKKHLAAYQSAPSSSSPDPAVLTFDITIRTGWLFSKTLIVSPTGPVPQMPDMSGWELNYSDKYTAQMARMAAWPQHQRPVRQVAELAFPSIEIPFMGGVNITFLPLEEDVEQNPRLASPAKRFMEASGVVSTQFALNFPGLHNAWCVWTTQPEKDRSPPAAAAAATAPSEKHQTAPNAAPENSKSKAGWTPFLKHYFIEDSSGDVIASYTRSAPWAPERGKLELYQARGRASPKLIESVVTACTAMVAMQDKMGMLTSLVEAGADAIVGKGKERA